MVVRDQTIYVEVVGEVPRDFVDFIKQVVENFYYRVGRKPELLEIYIYESTELKMRELSRIAVELGISVIGDYPLAHEAWAGWPRIHVDYEKCKTLDWSTLRALLVHECAHSVLHGSLASYTIWLGREVVETLGESTTELVYLASTVVKDLEVHEYMYRNGFENEVRAYYEYALRDMGELECRDARDLLILAKLISPCTVFDCKPELGYLVKESCKQHYDVVSGMLIHVKSLNCDLSCKVVELVRSLVAIDQPLG